MEKVADTKTSITPANGKNLKIQCLNIVGQIEGHMILPPQDKTTKYEYILPQLAALEQDDEVEGLLVLLNTAGGDVEAGLAISEMIAGMTKPTVSLVLGGGHSIGVPLAVSTDYSFIARSATMTLHPLRMNGMVIGVAQTFEYLSRIQDSIVTFISEHSKISKEDFNALMLKTGEIANDVGSIVFGEKAVECGLIDEVGTLKDAIAKLRELISMKNKK